ncbi:MAG: hypothetical protein ABUL72_06055, partial [Armatimonadota bacterium]
VREFDYKTVGQAGGPREVRGLGCRAFGTEGFDLISLLKSDPAAGHAWIEQESENIRSEMASATDGVFYRLAGCDPTHTSPMEYGGYFVPAEAAILDRASTQRIVWAESAPETYFDFLADIPCDLFGWDVETGPSVDEMRGIRRERLLADSEHADVRLISPVPNVF